MVIEWNKVTWYSKLLAVVLFVTVFAIAFYLGEKYTEVKQENSPTNNPEIIISNSDQVTLGVGQRGQIEGLIVTFNKFIQDSRCAVDVRCIWAGEVRVSITLTSDNHSETKEMSSIDEPYHFGNYSISIVDVTPSPHSKTKIDPRDYKVTFQNKFK